MARLTGTGVRYTLGEGFAALSVSSSHPSSHYTQCIERLCERGRCDRSLQETGMGRRRSENGPRGIGWAARGRDGGSGPRAAW